MFLFTVLKEGRITGATKTLNKGWKRNLQMRRTRA
jgi:hypothetical protein